MKIFHIMILMFLLMFTQKTYSGDINVENYSPYEIGKHLAGKMPQGWRCVYGNSMVIIIYEKKVDTLNLISLPLEPSYELAKKRGIKVDYFVVLNFVDKYSTEKYGELISTRNRALQEVATDDRDKQHYENVSRVGSKFILPKFYNNNYSAFFQQTASKCGKIYPEEVEKQANDIIAEIEKILKKYPEVPDDVQKDSQSDKFPAKNDKQSSTSQPAPDNRNKGIGDLILRYKKNLTGDFH